MEARERRVEYLREALDQAYDADWDLSGLRARSQLFPLGLLHAEEGRSRVQVASLYLKGEKRPAYSRTKTGDVEDRREQSERSWRPTHEWQRSGSVS